MQYIFLDADYQSAHILMGDLEKLPNVTVVYKDCLSQRTSFNWFVRLYISQRIKNKIQLPFKRYIYILLLKKWINKYTQYITLTSDWYDVTFIKLLKTRYPTCKLILILRDTVRAHQIMNKEFKINQAKQEFDLILSYDNVYDVPNYGLTYAPVYMSKIADLDISSYPETDLVFIAAIKDRLPIIHAIYQKLTDDRVNSFFYLMGVKQEDRLLNSSIIYTNKKMNRLELLKREVASNCILEILKGDAHSNTLRFWEAILYNKKFYTNWQGVVLSPYYNPQYIKVFTKVQDIDVDFIKEKIPVDYHYNNELSPIHLLSLIEEKINT